MIVALLAAGLALLAAACDRGSESAGQDHGANAAAPAGGGGAVTGRLDRSHAGTPAPSFTFEGPDGRPTSLAAFRGRPVLVNLWATWCAPCITEMPSLDALAQREGEALAVVTVSQDMAGREAVTRFFAQRRFQALEANLDQQMQFMTTLGLDTLPTTLLYDAQGREVWRMKGLVDWTSERAARLIAEADAG